MAIPLTLTPLQRQRLDESLQFCKETVEPADVISAETTKTYIAIEQYLDTLPPDRVNNVERIAMLTLRPALCQLRDLDDVLHTRIDMLPDSFTYGWIATILKICPQMRSRLSLSSSPLSLVAENLQRIGDQVHLALNLETHDLPVSDHVSALLDAKILLDEYLATLIRDLHELEDRSPSDNTLDHHLSGTREHFKKCYSQLLAILERLQLHRVGHATDSKSLYSRAATLAIAEVSVQRTHDEDLHLPCVILPSHRNTRFFGRQDELKKIDSYLFSDQSSGLCSLAIHGLGGVGKTQTALSYAFSKVDDLDAVIWLAAETEIALISSLGDAGYRIGLPGSEQGQNIENAQLVLKWLELTDIKWLLIYDNAESGPFLKRLVPKAKQGAILMTTRNVNLSRVPCSAGYQIKSFDVPSGSSFLLHLLHSYDISRNFSDEEKADALELSRQVGGHALALTQMAGLIDSRGWALSECLNLYQERPKKLHSLTEEVEIDANYKFFINTVFREGLEGVKHSDAYTLLGILSFLVPDGIPQELFEPRAPATLPGVLEFCKDHFSFDEAFSPLRRLALVDKQAKGRLERKLSLHRLVQQEFSFFVNQAERQTIFDATVSLLYRAFPQRVAARFMHSRWPECQMYIQHVSSLLENWRNESELPKLRAPIELCHLLSSAAWFIHELGSYEVLKGFLQSAFLVFDDEGLMRNAQMDYARLHMVEGVMWDNLGHFQKSIDCFMRCLQICKERLEDEDEFIGGIYNDLGNVSESLGDWQKALEWHEKAWKIRELSDDPTGENIAHSQSNTARALLMLDQDEEAYMRMDLAEKTFHAASASFHESHCHYCKGNYFRKKLNYPEAKKAYFQALDILRDRAGSKTHVRASACLFKLGAIAIAEGEPEAALELLEDCLKICDVQRQNLGDRARVMNMKAAALRRIPSKGEEAEQAQREAIVLYRELIGSMQKKPAKLLPTELDFDLLVCGLHR